MPLTKPIRLPCLSGNALTIFSRKLQPRLATCERPTATQVLLLERGGNGQIRTLIHVAVVHAASAAFLPNDARASREREGHQAMDFHCRLEHSSRPGSPYFVTWRLDGSLPVKECGGPSMNRAPRNRCPIMYTWCFALVKPDCAATCKTGPGRAPGKM